MGKYNIVDRKKFIYFQLPKVLVYGERYKNILNSDDRMLYMLLLDRLQVSIKNKWVDSEGDVYFVYENKCLMEAMRVSEPTLVRIKKRLKEAGLLVEEYTGRASRMYLLEPIEDRPKDNEDQDLQNVRDNKNNLITEEKENPYIYKQTKIKVSDMIIERLKEVGIKFITQTKLSHITKHMRLLMGLYSKTLEEANAFILKAIEVYEFHDGKSFQYLYSILEDWSDRGLTTVNEVEVYMIDRERMKPAYNLVR